MSEPDQPEEPGWQRLEHRTIWVSAAWAGGVSVAAGVPTALGIARGTSPLTAALWVLPAMLLFTLGGLVLEEIYWRRTRYRVRPDVVELTEGILVRRRRVLHRDRIRVVDLTAEPVTRALGLTKVSIGTGEQAGSGSGSLTLRTVTRSDGEALRAELLQRPAVTSGEQRPDGYRLADLDLGWVTYAPASFLTPLLGFSAAGAVMQVAEWFGAEGWVIDFVWDRFTGWPWPVSVLVLLVVSQVVGAIGAAAIFVEGWWHYRLDREPGGTLRVRRGLLTSRSVSLEEERLRGVEIVEPLGVRLAGAARVDAIATGMGNPDQPDQAAKRTLQPAAPRALAHGVAAEVLREPTLPSDTVTLTPHPRAAFGRRLRWALVTVVVVVAVLAVLGLTWTTLLLHAAWVVALIGVPAGVWLARDAYRNLGHGLTGEYVIARSGSFRRATVLLQRRGVVGWTARQSYFQRRLGLMTLTATTAAGTGGYDIIDVGVEEGTAFAATAMPDLIDPFLAGKVEPGPLPG